MKRLAAVAVLMGISIYAQEAIRIQSIQFQPTQTNKLSFIDKSGREHEITTEGFGTIIKKAEANPTADRHNPVRFSITPPAEPSTDYTVWNEGNDIHIKTGEGHYKIEQKMAWSACRNILTCDGYMESDYHHFSD